MAKEGTTKYLSNKQEKRTSKEFNGRTQPGSGCFWGAPGDVRAEQFLIENKYTTSLFTFKKSIWDKIAKEAIRDNFREPLLQLDFYVNVHKTVSFVIMDEKYFTENFNEFDFTTYRFFPGKYSVNLRWEDVKEWMENNAVFRWDISFTPQLRLIMLEKDVFISKINEL